MKNLIIKIDYITPKDPDEECLGQIIINDKEEELNEIFVMSLDFWSKEAYEQQWKEGIERLKTHNISCLVANVHNLKTKNPLIILWCLYKLDKKIYIQQKYFLKLKIGFDLKKLNSFTINNCYEFVTPREITDEDGNKLSEWCIDYEE